MFNAVAVFGLGRYQQNGINELKNKGFRIIGFDEKKNPYSINSVDKLYKIPFSNIKKIQNICAKNNVKHLFAFNTDAPLKLISILNKRLKLYGYKERNIELISDKIELRKFFKFKMNLHSPKYFHFNNFNEIQKKKIKKLNFPIVCKPNVGSGSRGVFLAYSYDDLSKLFKVNKKFYKTNKILLEQFINNEEYAVEGWAHKKKFFFGCLSKKTRSKPPYLLDTDLIINYQNIEIKKKVTSFLNIFLKKNNINNVPIHFEFFEHNKKIIPIDISLRGAGFGVYSNILSKIMNQSTDNILINLLMNKKIMFNNPNQIIFYLNFFYSKREGFFNGIKNQKKLLNLDSFLEFELYKKINSKVFFLKNGSNRLGHCLLGANNKKIYKDIKFVKNFVKTKVSNERI